MRHSPEKSRAAWGSGGGCWALPSTAEEVGDEALIQPYLTPLSLARLSPVSLGTVSWVLVTRVLIHNPDCGAGL